MTKSRRPIAMMFVLVALFVALWPTAAAACAVCYGDNAESGFIRGAQWATVLLVGVTYGMLTCGVAVFLALRRRGQQATKDARESQTGGPQSERSPGRFAVGHQGAE